MKRCEKCNKEHDGSFGSGRFCSTFCSRAFSGSKSKGTKKPRDKKYSLVNKKCKECSKEFSTYFNIFCSRSCAITFRNKNIKFSKARRLKMSKSLKTQYKKGREVKGGNTKWYSYKDLKVQGTYELSTCKILDTWKSEGKIKDWEYTNDRFPYIFEGKEHTYLLDFKIFEEDNSFWYLEVKGWKKDNDEAKWKTVRDLGYKLEVWYEEDIKNNMVAIV